VRAGLRQGLLVGLPIALGACASVARPPAVAPARVEALVDQHHRRAATLEQSGHLRQAYEEWEIALTLSPGDPVARAGLTAVAARIEQAVADRLGHGRAALARGAPLEARHHLLAVLALDPANREAFEALRAATASVRSPIALARADEGREAGPPGPPPPRAPAGGEAAETNPLLADAREALEAQEFDLALTDVDKLLAGSPGYPEGVDLKKAILYRHGRAQFDGGRYAGAYRAFADLGKLDPRYLDSAALRDQVRNRLIQELYQDGIRLYRDEDLEAAVAKWRAVLDYDPSHAEARKNIDQAERLLRALQERRQDTP
jgi:tetratricopeptide (TPR) repeat protein